MLNAEQITAIIRDGVPGAVDIDFQVESVEEDRVWCRLPYRPGHLRPGGTLSGPAMMSLADAAMYAAVIHRLGRIDMAVTQNLNINFLSRPEPGDLLACAQVMKLGRRSAVLEVRLYSVMDDEMVAHVTGTYALPAAMAVV